MSKKSVYTYKIPQSDLSLTDLSVASKSETKILILDGDGDRLIIEGTGLTYKDGLVTAGHIDEVTIRNDDRRLLLSATNLDIDVKTLPTGEPAGVFEYSMFLGTRHDNVMIGSKGDDELHAGIGNDVMKGRGGADTLEGNRGNDMLTGGSGEDLFVFDEGDGKDTITDFDADFTDNEQDLIDVDYSTVVGITNVKGNAVINFGDGDTITLLGVKANEIDGSDFVS